MRVLGVDYGLRRIGLATGETEVRMAFAKGVLQGRGDPESDAAAVCAFAKAEECELIVIGLPVLDDGHEGEQAEVTRRFGDALTTLGAKVEFFDERYSSSAARASLSHLDPRSAKSVLDAEAARIILEGYLQS